jgi:hypothetical protein
VGVGARAGRLLLLRHLARALRLHAQRRRSLGLGCLAPT